VRSDSSRSASTPEDDLHVGGLRARRGRPGHVAEVAVALVGAVRDVERPATRLASAARRSGSPTRRGVRRLDHGRRRRGHERARGLVGERLQGQDAALDELALGPAEVVVAVAPAPPGLRGVREGRLRVQRRRRLREHPRRGDAARSPRARPRARRRGRARTTSRGPSRRRGPGRTARSGAADGGDAHGVRTIVGHGEARTPAAGRPRSPTSTSPGQALHEADHGVRDVEADLVHARARRHRQRVRHADAARGRPHLRLEDERPRRGTRGRSRTARSARRCSGPRPRRGAGRSSSGSRSAARSTT
jgi:hypothetical protein